MFRRILLAVVTLVVAVGAALTTAAVATASPLDDGVIRINDVSVDLCRQTGLGTVNAVTGYLNGRGPTVDVTDAQVEAALGGRTVAQFRDARCHRPGGPVGLPRYGSCSDYNRAGVWDIRRGDPRYRADWDRDNRGLICTRPPQQVTIVDGNCDSVSSQRTVLVNNYRGAYDRYNTVLNSYRAHRDPVVLRQLNDRYNDWRTARDRWDSGRQTLVVQCKQDVPDVTYNVVQSPDQACGCNAATPPVTVTQTAAPAPAPAPAPLYSTVPNTQKGWDNGDGSFPLER